MTEITVMAVGQKPIDGGGGGGGTFVVKKSGSSISKLRLLIY